MDTTMETGGDIMSVMRAKVDELYDFRDHYFERNSIEKAIQKTDDVKKELETLLKALDEAQGQIESKSEYLLLRGRALNILPEFSPEAYDCLSKAVKLDPKLVEAWNHLGECYWKKRDIMNAKNCFTGALNYSRNKVSLRNLSMVLRQLGGTPEERTKFMQESLNNIKEALQLDFNDGTTWFIAGNTYLSLFFASGQSPSILKQCLGAYAKAEEDSVAKNNPDLHFNRAAIYRFQEEYQLALEGYDKARALDPLWQEPQDKRKEMINFLWKVTELVRSKGKVKNKKLQQMISSLKEADLGPYSGGSYTGANKETIKLVPCSLANLSVGQNAEKVVVGKVVCSISLEEPIPFTFAFVDSEGTCYAVNLYNIAQGQGVIIGDSVAIPEPFVQRIDFTIDDKHINFSSIRVMSPVFLVVNRRKLGADKQAPATLQVSTMSE